MEFSQDLARLVGAPSDHSGPFVGRVDERVLRGEHGGFLGTVLEELGKRSAVAQGLRRPVTFGSASSLADQRVYLIVDGRTAIGFLKVGSKSLFVAAPQLWRSPADRRRGGSGFVDVQDALRKIEPLCALDFYVHERCQRRGFGLQLFEAMLACEGALPAFMGYDRPSPKLLGFLKTHFGLSKYQPQNNNFVVFDRYFDAEAEASSAGSPKPASASGSAACAAATPLRRQPEGAGDRHEAAGLATSPAGAAWRGGAGRQRDFGGAVPDLFGRSPAACGVAASGAGPASTPQSGHRRQVGIAPW